MANARGVNGSHKENYEPTADEIAAGCAVIQDAWTEEERLRRMGKVAPIASHGTRKECWDVPVIEMGGIDLIDSSDSSDDEEVV